MTAGNIRFISHKIETAESIPTVFDEKTPKTNKATEPLTPISAIVIVGVTVINKKINITENSASEN